MSRLAIITGASRGYGRGIALEFAKKDKTAHFLLLGRTESGLKETQQSVAKITEGSVNVFPIDLGALDSLEQQIDSLFSTITPSAYSSVYLFNNSGSLGEVAVTRDLSNLRYLQQEMDHNVTSCMWLTRTFLRKFQANSCFIINISSGAAVNAAATWSIYCTGKAAREMFHRVLAEEERDNPRVKVLNWSPGIMPTEMQQTLQEKGQPSSTKEFLGKVISQGKATTVEESAGELIKYLWSDFTSGAREDLYALRPDLKERLSS